MVDFQVGSGSGGIGKVSGEGRGDFDLDAHSSIRTPQIAAEKVAPELTLSQPSYLRSNLPGSPFPH